MARTRTASQLTAWTVGLLVLTAAGGVHADDRADVILLRAERLAAADQCGEMLELAESAPEPARSSPELMRLEGNCLIDLARYDEAVTKLNAAREADPALADVDLLIAIALYHQEDLDGAAAALERARGNTTRPAELDLYTGLVLLQQGQPRDAALALERARTADPEAVEPVASYYAALAWHAERERDRARAALARVRAIDPEGPWSRQASAALSNEVNNDPYWVRLTAGLEYDSNVRLSPAGAFPDEDDGRAIWVAEGGVRLFEQEDWSAGLVGSYSGSAHFDLNEFDTHYPVAGIYLDRRIEERDLLRLRYDIGYAWVDYDPFLLSQYTRASWFHAWEKAGLTELFVAGEFNNYKFDILLEPAPPAGVTASSRDRDGEGIHTGVEHRVPLGVASAVGRAGYTYQRYWSDGTEWDYDSHRFHVGVSALLPWEIVFETEGAYAYRPHRNPTTFFNPDGTGPSANDRHDHVYGLDVSFEKNITERVSASTAYTFVHSDSNSGFFDYNRHVVGAYVSVTLP